MSDVARTPTIDAVITALLQAPDDAEALRLADEAARHADAAMRGAIARRLRAIGARQGDAAGEATLAEVRAEAADHLAARLLTLRRGAHGAAEARTMGDLRAHASGLAGRIADGWARRRHAGRARLRNRLRYLLARDRRFMLRPTPDEEWRCGLAGRDARTFASGEAAGPGRRIPEAPPAAARGREPAIDPNPVALAALVIELLTKAGGPVDLEQLTDAVAERVVAPTDGARTDGLRTDGAGMAHERDAVDEEEMAAADPRGWLERLWADIAALPPMCRATIAFGLRDADGRGVIGLFPSAGVAGIRRIADALGLSPERLADLWKGLPLDDNGIAARIGVTRPQVALLRRAARARLARRMARR
jgi:hypothetical protein